MKTISLLFTPRQPLSVYDFTEMTCVSSLGVPDICVGGFRSAFPDLQVHYGELYEITVEAVKGGRFRLFRGSELLWTAPISNPVAGLVDEQIDWLLNFTEESGYEFNLTARLYDGSEE